MIAGASSGVGVGSRSGKPRKVELDPLGASLPLMVAPLSCAMTPFPCIIVRPEWILV